MIKHLLKRIFLQMFQGEWMQRCGASDVYIKPECVCTFNNVYQSIYHRYSSCPHGEESDVVTQLKCTTIIHCKEDSYQKTKAFQRILINSALYSFKLMNQTKLFCLDFTFF